MPRQGLNRQALVCAAAELIAQRGMRDFSMRELAQHMNVKTASLYNHVESMEALLSDVARWVIGKLVDEMRTAVAGKTGAQAVRSLAQAYMHFGKHNYEWYKLIISLPLLGDAALAECPKPMVDVIMDVLHSFGLTEEMCMHQQRILRSIMHGFLSQEAHGGFSHFPVDVKDSYDMAIAGFIAALK